MNHATQTFSISGPAGSIELSLDIPAQHTALRGLALVGHPHPLFGGTKDNKVAQTLARSLIGLGYACIRPNFRGVGGSSGQHDAGIAEQDDLLAVIEWMRQPAHWLTVRGGEPIAHIAPTTPFVLGGFSFGSFVISHVAQRLVEAGTPAERLILVGTATSRWTVAPVPADTIVIHGEFDDTVPLSSVLEWARPQDLPVTVIPGADHFFHRKLHLIRQCIAATWK
jgi:uncharacterized protein